MPRFDKVVIAVVTLCMGAAPAMAGWTGSETTQDGVVHVVNPAAPIEAASTVAPDELWRVGGEEDEDVIFGVLSAIKADDAGNLYLLDQQLVEVMVFSRSGEYLRSIGREGEGPGEFRRPGGMFLTPSGDVAVLQRMPGRIILMSADGDPIGNHPVPEAPDGGMMMFSQGERAGDYLVLDINSFARRETGMEITRKLVRIDSQGNIVNTLHTRTDERNFASMSFDEKEMNELQWTCSDDGRVFVSDNFDAYAITVYGPDGGVERVIERDYEHRQRSGDEMERNKPRIMFRRRGGRTEAPETKASETDRDIQAMYPRADGTLWVVSSRGGLSAPEGVIAIFDVFDRDGRFTRQVTVQGDCDFEEDGLHFVDDRLYVVKGFRSAQRAQRGGDDEATEEELENAEPISVICYDLGPIVQGKN